MSLILDALKKSEAERNRGLPPGLYAHHRTPKRTRRTPWVAGAGAVLLVAGLSGGWLMLARGRTVPAVPANTLANVDRTDVVAGFAPADSAAPQVDNGAVNFAQTGTMSNEARSLGGLSGDGRGMSVSGGGLPVPKRAGLFTPTLTPQPTLVQAPAADKPPVSAAPPAAAQSVAAAPVAPKPPQIAAVPVAPPPTVAMVAEPVKPEPVAVPTPAAVAVVPAPAPAVPAPAAAAPAPAPPVVEPIAVIAEPAPPAKPEEVLPMVFQLPYATRKDLPKLEMSMHVYSPIRAERFVVLNGKRLTLDMPPPGPDLALLEILSDGAVFEFRGQRFVLPRQTY